VNAPCDDVVTISRLGPEIKAGNMFVIELIYKADLAAIDAQMRAHVKFLKKYYASGNFLVSGRKIPRDGGIILAVAPSRERIQAIVEEDPFVTRGLADVRIIEFRASQQADDIDRRISASVGNAPTGAG
jgi:uncharacterized protein YciI